MIRERNEGGGWDHNRGAARETHTCPGMPWETCEAMEREVEIEYIACKRTQKAHMDRHGKIEIDNLSESVKVAWKQIQLKHTRNT